MEGRELGAQVLDPLSVQNKRWNTTMVLEVRKVIIAPLDQSHLYMYELKLSIKCVFM